MWLFNLLSGQVQLTPVDVQSLNMIPFSVSFVLLPIVRQSFCHRKTITLRQMATDFINYAYLSISLQQPLGQTTAAALLTVLCARSPAFISPLLNPHGLVLHLPSFLSPSSISISPLQFSLDLPLLFHLAILSSPFVRSHQWNPFTTYTMRMRMIRDIWFQICWNHELKTQTRLGLWGDSLNISNSHLCNSVAWVWLEQLGTNLPYRTSTHSER